MPRADVQRLIRQMVMKQIFKEGTYRSQNKFRTLVSYLVVNPAMERRLQSGAETVSIVKSGAPPAAAGRRELTVEEPAVQGVGGASVLAPEQTKQLYEKLVALRREIARSKKTKAVFTIFPNSVIAQLVEKTPTSTKDLAPIKGLGLRTRPRSPLRRLRQRPPLRGLRHRPPPVRPGMLGVGRVIRMMRRESPLGDAGAS